MIALLRVLLALSLAAGLGLGLTYYTLKGSPPLGLISIGPWQTLQNAGMPHPDPYTRSIYAARGQVPLSVGDGLSFQANHDSDGKSFEARCPVEISGSINPARFWTLSLYDQNWAPLDHPIGQTTLNSQNSVYEPNGQIKITISATPHSGNWLFSGGQTNLRLILNLYDTPAALTLGQKGALTLPQIKVQPC